MNFSNTWIFETTSDEPEYTATKNFNISKYWYRVRVKICNIENIYSCPENRASILGTVKERLPLSAVPFERIVTQLEFRPENSDCFFLEKLKYFQYLWFKFTEKGNPVV